MAQPVEEEIMLGRRAYGAAQAGFASEPVDAPLFLDTGWYDTSVHPEIGYFAVVGRGRGHDDLVGKVVRVTIRGRAIFVYVIGSRPVPNDLALYRRAFAHVCSLQVESIPAVVEGT